LTLSAGVGNIGNGVFNGCTSLVTVTIPSSVTGIGYSAFEGCSNLANIYIYNENCDISTTNSSTLGIPGYTVVHGYEGSTAQNFATAKGYAFEKIGTVGDYEIGEEDEGINLG